MSKNIEKEKELAIKDLYKDVNNLNDKIIFVELLQEYYFFLHV